MSSALNTVWKEFNIGLVRHPWILSFFPHCIDTMILLAMYIMSYIFGIFSFALHKVIWCQPDNLHICDLLWRNEEQVARQMFLILPVQYMTNIHMHSTRHNVNNKHIITNKAHILLLCVHVWLYMNNSSIKVVISCSYWNGVPQLLNKNSMHCWFLLNEELAAVTCSLAQHSRPHICPTK